MKERCFQYALRNDDIVIVEIKKVYDSKYQDGIMYTFRCMSSNGETLFAIENSHGRPHIHYRHTKESADYDWKTAWDKFDEMVREHKRKIEKD